MIRRAFLSVLSLPLVGGWFRKPVEQHDGNKYFDKETYSMYRKPRVYNAFDYIDGTNINLPLNERVELENGCFATKFIDDMTGRAIVYLGKG